ncbi:hypothetical protein PR202_gb01149 [Eleusine coracana subsp. coracana]|uniref:TF-B3 domain-containing protein n=1 Tax=Eleusine coracana subsp. coracana TaxID=191504 RepID=A0AAV5DWP4_ELECO|nr:hypothetical protein PR202_gb01149 [Eleusine coracana subsp. coracana]
MGKRCVVVVVYDPEQQHAKRPRPNDEEAGGALVPYNAAAAAQHVVEDAQPLNAAAAAPEPQLVVEDAQPEPPCLRGHVLHALGLRGDLPMHFIDKKTVTSTDLDAHQNRFRLPSEGVLERLRPLLTLEELHAANLLYDPEPRAKKPKQLQLPAPPETSTSSEKVVKKKKRGRVHGGLPVRMVDLAAGASWELRLSRWESSHGTIVKGEGYLDFIRRCSFKENDHVEIWAFKQHYFRNFGVIMCYDSVLHLFIVKKDSGAPKTCRYCPPPAPAPVDESSELKLLAGPSS